MTSDVMSGGGAEVCEELTGGEMGTGEMGADEAGMTSGEVAGEQPSGEMMSGVEAGGIGGAEEGGVREEACDEARLEVCGDLEDQDCDGAVDEGCGECLGVESSVARSPGIDSFTMGVGALSVGSGRGRAWALFGRADVGRVKLYSLTTARDELNDAYQLEVGSARAVFEWGDRLGVLINNGDSLTALRVNASGGAIEGEVVLTGGETSGESVWSEAGNLRFVWSDADGEVWYREARPDVATVMGSALNLSDAPYRSGAPSITLTEVGAVVAFEDERAQGSHPQIMLSQISSARVPSDPVVVVEGYDPQVVWSGGRLLLIARQEVASRRELRAWVLDHNDPEFRPLGPPQLIYASEHELDLISVTGLGDELVALWREVRREGESAQVAQLLYLTNEGEPSRGPFRMLTVNSASAKTSLSYQSSEDQVLAGWIDADYEVGLGTFQFLRVQTSSAEGITCPLAP